jgi:hypothetical protein
MGDIKIAHRTFTGKLEGKRLLERSMCSGNIILKLLGERVEKWRAVVDTVRDFRVP